MSKKDKKAKRTRIKAVRKRSSKNLEDKEEDVELF